MDEILRDSDHPLAHARVALGATQAIETILSTWEAFLLGYVGVGGDHLGLAICHAFIFIEEQVERLITSSALSSRALAVHALGIIAFLAIEFIIGEVLSSKEPIVALADLVSYILEHG